MPRKRRRSRPAPLKLQSPGEEEETDESVRSSRSSLRSSSLSPVSSSPTPPHSAATTVAAAAAVHSHNNQNQQQQQHQQQQQQQPSPSFGRRASSATKSCGGGCSVAGLPYPRSPRRSSPAPNPWANTTASTGGGGSRSVYFPFGELEASCPPPPRSPCYEAPRSPGRIATAATGRCYSPVPLARKAPTSPSPQRSSTPSVAGSPFHSPTPSRNLSPNQLSRSPSVRSPVMPRSSRGSCRSPVPPRSPMGHQPIPTTPRSPSPSPLPQRTTRQVKTTFLSLVNGHILYSVYCIIMSRSDYSDIGRL